MEPQNVSKIGLLSSLIIRMWLAELTNDLKVLSLLPATSKQLFLNETFYYKICLVLVHSEKEWSIKNCLTHADLRGCKVLCVINTI